MAGWWRAMRAVGAAFFGVRAGREHAEDLRQLHPLMVVGVALVLAALFVMGLVLIVRWVAP